MFSQESKNAATSSTVKKTQVPVSKKERKEGVGGRGGKKRERKKKEKEPGGNGARL